MIRKCLSINYLQFQGLFILFVFFNHAYAQPTRFFSGQKIEAKDGLSVLNIHKIVTDPYGFYWIASQDGLNRFDGLGFHKFAPGATEAGKNILGSDVYDLATDTERDELYALTAYGGLNIISLKRNIIKNRVPIGIKGKSPPWLRSCATYGNFVFCGSDEGLLFRYNKTKQAQDADVSITRQFGAKYNGAVSQITTDANGRVWLCIDKTGVLITDSTFSKLLNFFPVADTVFFSGYCTNKNNIVFSSTGGLFSFSLQNISAIPINLLLFNIPPELTMSLVKCCTANNGQFIFITPNKLYSYENNKWEVFELSNDTDERNWLNFAYAVCINGKSLLIGGQYGILFIKKLNSPFTYFSAYKKNNDEVRIPHGTTLYSTSDSIVFSCSTTLLYRINTYTGSIKQFGAEDFYFNIFSPEPGLLISSGQNTKMRLYNYEGMRLKLSSHYPELKTLADSTYLISATPYRDSLLLLACEAPKKGLIIWNRKKHTTQFIDTNTQPITLKSDVINRVFLDSENNIWIVCDDAVSIYNHKKNTMRHLPLTDPNTKEPLRINMDVCESPNNFWLAVYGMGIVKLRKDYTVDTIFGFREGLKSTGLYKIFNYGDSLILASSNNGLIVLRMNTGSVINYFQPDGLMSDNFEETSGYQITNAVYFGGARGVTKINPAVFSFAQQPLQLFFTDLEIVKGDSVTNKFDLSADLFSVPYDCDRVTLHFTATGPVYPDKVQFQFRIREKGNEWINLGTRRFIDLTGLSHGIYQVEVRAADETGVWSSPKTLTLRFLPKWHQTMGFKFAVGFFIFGLVYAFYRYRISQIKKQQKIRKDISNDLHDDIGSTLNSVKVYTHLALEGKDKEHYIQMARQNLEQASIGLRDMIWVLDDKLDTADELLTRIKQFAIPLANALQIETDFKCDFDIQHKVFTKDEKRNLLLICKEAINNCFKYSEACLLSVHFTPEKKNVRVTIADNGKGFDMSTASAGNGLKNMRHRALQIGYQITITSAPEQGTTITVFHA